MSPTGRFRNPLMPHQNLRPVSTAEAGAVLMAYRQSYNAQFRAYHEQVQRMMDRQAVLNEYKKLYESIPPGDGVLRGMFARWWGVYRVKNQNIYDVAQHPRMIAEVRIGFAKCVEAARERRRIREAREAQRRHNWETYGRQHR